MRFSNTLTVERDAGGSQVRCAACSTALSRSDQNWKSGARLQAVPVDQLGGPYGTGRDLQLRQFICPSCGVLLDTELAFPDDPWLDDRLFVAQDG